MSTHATVQVSGISPATSEKDVRDFFSFWYVYPSHANLPTKSYVPCANYSPLQNSGKIVNLSITPVSSEPDSLKSASVTFEKEA